MLRIRLPRVCFALVAALLWAAPAAAADAEPSRAGICGSPGNETFEQMIRRHYRQADAVFSGEVRELTIERATVAVMETWKGDLAPEVAMPTGVTRNQDGSFTIHGEVFSFGKSQKYILFGFGKPAKGKRVDSLSTSRCEPNVDLARAGATIAVLDAIVGGPQRPRSAQNEPVVPFEEVVACAAAGTCRNLKPGVLGWFDTVGNRVNQFSRDGFTYSVAAAGSLLRVWIALPGEGRPTRLLTLGAGGRVVRAEMGPIPGEGGPRRMSADELESWRRAHKVYVAADAPGSGWVGGDEFFPFWQEQAARAWNAIQRQLSAPQESRPAFFETLVAWVKDGNCRNSRAVSDSPSGGRRRESDLLGGGGRSRTYRDRTPTRGRPTGSTTSLVGC